MTVQTESGREPRRDSVVPTRPALSRWRDRVVAPCLAVSAVILGWLFWEFAHTNRTLDMRALQIRLFFAAFVVFLLAVSIVLRSSVSRPGRLAWGIVIAGILFRLSVAPVRPATTSDIYRYLWEGRVVRAGFNPYAEPPASPQLAHLRDWVWPLVQHKSVPAAYPPLAQYVFALAGILPIHRVIGLKLLFAAFDILTLLLLPGLLARLGRPRSWVILYAWHPLVVCEVVARGHFDALGILLLVAAMRLSLATSAPGRSLAGAALGASIAAKGYALIVAPFWLLVARPHARAFTLALLGVVALAWLPFFSAGASLLRGTMIYAESWRGNASVFALVDVALGRVTVHHATAARAICAAALSLWLVHLILKARRTVPALDDSVRLSFLALAGLFLLSPVVYPWYLAWTVPFLCLRPNSAWLVLTGSIFAFYGHDFAGHHRELAWITTLEYGIPLAVAIAPWAWRRLRAGGHASALEEYARVAEESGTSPEAVS